MANAKEFRESEKQGYRFEKWCCDKFKLIPSEKSYQFWKIHKITRKKYRFSKDAILDAYDPETKYDIEIKATIKKNIFESWKRGRTKWCRISSPQKSHPCFLVIVGLIENKKVIDWIILKIEHNNGAETSRLLLEKATERENLNK